MKGYYLYNNGLYTAWITCNGREVSSITGDRQLMEEYKVKQSYISFDNVALSKGAF